ncbi:hypothetical protein ACSBLW_07595 [Thioclava sp. FR2]|uniref:hypothetical protein n=1 Tax=Thioclava sp. FR2 TaxID=3445780 RepID=UPI003EC111A2
MTDEMMKLAHIGAGLMTLCLYWAVLLRRKGNGRHRMLGHWFLYSWGAALASVGLVTMGRSGRFSPPEVVQFVYLSLCVIVVGATVILSRRWKSDLPRFRGAWFRGGGAAIFGLGGLVLVAGLASGDALPVAFSTVGLIYGGAMLRFAFLRSEVHPNWALIWHLNGVIFFFNAIHGTLLAVLLRAWIWPEAGDGLNVATHFATLAVCLWMRLWYGARYAAPLRLTAGPVVVVA